MPGATIARPAVAEKRLTVTAQQVGEVRSSFFMAPLGHFR